MKDVTNNVDAAKILIGLVLNHLKGAFPATAFVSHKELWPDFEALAEGAEISIKWDRRSWRHVPVSEVSSDEGLQKQYTRYVLNWMKSEGYLHIDPSGRLRYDYVLSAKALAVLDIHLDNEKVTLGLS